MGYISYIFIVKNILILIKLLGSTLLLSHNHLNHDPFPPTIHIPLTQDRKYVHKSVVLYGHLFLSKMNTVKLFSKPVNTRHDHSESEYKETLINQNDVFFVE